MFIGHYYSEWVEFRIERTYHIVRQVFVQVLSYKILFNKYISLIQQWSQYQTQLDRN